MAKRRNYVSYGIVGIIAIVIVSLILIIWVNSRTEESFQKTGLASSQQKQDCIASSSRPCYDKQTGKNILGIEDKGGEKAFDACLKTNTFLGSSGSLITTTSKCGQERFLYCYEGKSKIFLRKFMGCEIPTVPEPTLNCPRGTEFSTLSYLDASWSMSNPTQDYLLRTLFKSKKGDIFAAGLKIEYATETYWDGYAPVMYKSIDKGVSWASIVLPYSRTSLSTWMTVLTIAEDNNGVIYAGGNLLWKSTDDGNTWTALSLPYPNNYWGGYTPITYLTIAKDNSLIAVFAEIFSAASPNDPNYIRPKVSRSTDGGNTWNEIFTHNYFITSILEAEDGSLVYRDWQYTNPSGVHRYTNGIVTQTFTDGPTSMEYNAGLSKGSNNEIYFISPDKSADINLVDYTQTGTAYLAVYKSIDNGMTWTQLGSLPNSWETEATVIESSDGTLYAASWSNCYRAETIYKSEDKGTSWKIVANAPVFGKGNKADPYFRYEISSITEASGKVLIAGNTPVIFSTP